MTHVTNSPEAAIVKRAFQAVEKLQAQVATLEYSRHEPIAIIGMACRFPGPPTAPSDSPAAYWSLLCQGVDAIQPLPPGRRVNELGDKPVDPTRLPVAGFLAGVDGFDPEFFGISPREAVTMDPQQRLLLEVSWEALESAGRAPAALLHSDTGVFIGMCINDYRDIVRAKQAHNRDILDLAASVGTLTSVAAGRLSYTLGLTGPAMLIDTACSSSLVAVHQACQSLRNGECTLALAGGVNLILNHDWVNGLSQEGAPLTSDNRCKTFDAAADGTARGEGCGIVVLKRLSAAQADGDPILALIRGSMVNQDGRSSTLSAPSGPAQQRLLQQALQQARVTPDQVSYIEAHGTGTKLGDPIEMGAINAVFHQRSDPLWVGSVKTNFGHLEGAAGIAGLIKIVLMLQHGQIPPHLHFHTPNPYIDWAGSPVQIPLTLTAWPAPSNNGASRRIAGVSSFGLSGTNAHAILEEAPPRPAVPATAEADNSTTATTAWQLLTLSARSETALQALAQSYERLLATTTLPLADLCYTSQTGRTHFAHRLAVPANSLAQMQRALTTYRLGDGDPLPFVTGYAPKHAAPVVAFLFTGQGDQYVGMGRELYASEATFRATLDRCEAIAQEALGRSLHELLYPAAPPDHHDLQQSHPCAQAANFALQCALVALWRSWGIQPDYVLGHSLGDFAAAYAAGVLSLEDGLRLVIKRGQLMATARSPLLGFLTIADVIIRTRGFT